MTLRYSTLDGTMTAFRGLCREAVEAAPITVDKGKPEIPDLWPEGQSDQSVKLMKQWWAGTLVQFADGSFAYTPPDGEVVRRADGATAIKVLTSVGGSA